MRVRLLTGALALAVALAAGTTPTPQVVGPGATPATSTTAPPTRAPAEPAATARTAPARKPAQVVRVVDGDTLRLRVDGREEPVRLIGINTRESVDPRRPVECLGKEASAKTAELLRGVPTVEVEPAPTQDARGAYARLLLYVWLPDGRLLNRELIASGYAHEHTFRAPSRFQAEIRQAQREAEAARRGLWAPGACESQAPISRSTPAPGAVRAAGLRQAAGQGAPMTASHGVPPMSRAPSPPRRGRGSAGGRSGGAAG